MIRKVWFNNAQNSFELGDPLENGMTINRIGYYLYEQGFRVVRVMVGFGGKSSQIYCEIPVTSVSHVFYKLGE